MKSADGNETARPLANESLADRVQLFAEEKKSYPHHLSLRPSEPFKPDGEMVVFSDFRPRSPELASCGASLSPPRPDIPKKPRKQMPRRPSDMLQAGKLFLPQEDRSRPTDLRIESTRLQDPDLAAVDRVWSTLLFLCTIYNYFTFFFFLGIQLSPPGVWLVFEVLTELILLVDAVGMSFINFRLPRLLNQLPLLSQVEGKELEMPRTRLLMRLVSSYPQHSVNLLCRVGEMYLESLPLALLRGLKLLRYQETMGYIKSHLRQVKGAYAVYVQAAQNIFTIVILFQIMCSIWLLVVRLESPAPWKYKFGFDKADTLEYFSVALLFAVSNRGGTAPGDSYPVSPLEKLTFCALVFCSSTTVAALFGSLASGIYITNARTIENNRKLDQIKIYSSTRNLPEELKLKLKSYFSLMHLEYSKYEEQYALLQDLPTCLKGELVLHINVDFIQKVKLFQLSESSFIVAMVNNFKPIISLSGDYIVRRGEMADSMYFIKKGFVRALCADDEKIVLAYMGEGCYFGEIGVLITGKRSASVVAHTNCVLYYLTKESLMAILEPFGYHKVFLESVGHQRMRTTYLRDLQQDENISAAANMTNATVLYERTSTMGRTMRESTSHGFIIEANSKLHAFGSILLGVAILWNLSYTMFAICFEDVMKTETKGVLIFFDVLLYLVCVLDIPFQYLISSPLESSFYSSRAMSGAFRINFWLLLDVLSIVPFDYTLWAIGHPSTWLRCVQILKVYRLYDVQNVIRTQFKMFHLFNMVLLSMLYFISSHVIACLLYAIAIHEYNRGGRFDGRSFVFNWLLSVNQSYTLFEDVMNDTIGNRYVHCIYTGICMMGLASFGDVVTFTPLEDLYSSIVTIYSKLFMAFFYAEVANYMSGFYSSYVEHVSKTYQILSWLKLNNLPITLSTRVTNYRNILWRKFKGVEESSLISSMPSTLGYKIKYYILEKFVQNADVIPKDEPGAIVAIVKNLSIRVYPKGEFVIMEGEIGTEMFFLIEGIVDIYNSRGVRLNRLTEGKCFGEMALLKDEAQIRMASAYCATDVSVAILKKEEFATICKAYPLFKDKIFETVREREAQNVIKEAATIRVEPRGAPAGLNDSRVMEPSVKKSVTSGSILSYPTQTRGLVRLSTIIESRVAGDVDVTTIETEETGTTPKKKIIITVVKFVACLYNFIFIPLQMAFRIEYTPALYTIEGIIMVLNLADIVHLVMKYRSYGSKVFAESENEEDSDEQRRINEELAVKKRYSIAKSICWECFTFLPWSIILQNVYYPAYVVAFVKMLRLIKFWPLVKLLSLLKVSWLNAIRILEVIFYYFIFAHMMTCLMILMMYIPKTFNESWVRRIPYPQVDIYGARTGDDMTGVTNSDIYIAGLYVTYMTLSHVTMGDISAVNINERILTTIYVAFSLHLYVVLFASITSMVSDLAKSLQATLQHKYESLLSTIRGNNLPEELLKRIKDYFDYLWLESKGIATDHLDGLPDGIRSDIQMILYKKALDNGFLFKGTRGTLDRRVAMSFFKLAKIKKCMKGDIIIKAGSNCTKTVLLLEGELALIGVPNSRVGMLKPGLFFGNTLDENARQPRPAHLVATIASTIAIMREKDLMLLTNAFPTMKARLHLANQIIYSRCQDALEDYIHTIEVQKPPADVLEDEYVMKDEKGYDLVLEEAMKPVDPFTVDLNKAINATYSLIQENQGETGSTSNMVPPRFTRLNRSKARIQTDEEEEHTYFLYPDMRHYYVIYLVHLLNIAYTACSIPLQIGFKQIVGPEMIAFEAVCLVESMVHIVLRLRTIVLLRGQTFSYAFSDIFRTYRENGFFFDVFGALPFNLIFMATGLEHPLYIIVPLKLARVLIIGNASHIIFYFQLLNHNLSSPIHLLTILSSFFMLWHWITSAWHFVVIDCEPPGDLTWEKVNELEGEYFPTQYSFAMYYMLKLTAGAGSADAYSATNLERIVSCLIVHVGDVLFAVIFGLIAAYASSLTSEMGEYLMQRKKVDEFAESFEITKEHKERTEEYFSYMRSLSYRPILYQNLKEQLPSALAKEIVFAVNKRVLGPVFAGFGSLNFLKKLSYSIEIVHYAPGDYITQRGELGNEMHFIIEGRAAFIAADKHTVIKRVEKGQYFGESALFIKKRREYFVRAETYACVCVLQKKDFEGLITKFSRLRGKVRRMAREYDHRVGNKVQCESESEEEVRLDIISTLQGLKRHQSETDVRQQLESYTKKRVVRARRKAQSRLNVVPAEAQTSIHKESTFSVMKNKKMNEDSEEEKNPYEPLSEQQPLGSVENHLMTNNFLIEDNTPESGNDNNKLGMRRAPSNAAAKPQRRLSKLTLGKQLAISQNKGVQFEWTVSRSSNGEDVKI